MNQIRSILLASGKQVSMVRLSAWLGVPRSTAYYQPRQRSTRPVDEALAARIKRIHQQESSCGVRGTWSRLRFEQGLTVNRKKVHRLMKLKGWTIVAANRRGRANR